MPESPPPHNYVTEMAARRASWIEHVNRYDEARNYVDQGDFHSERDRWIASDTVDRIQVVAREQQVAPEAYEAVLDSVRVLVPKRGSDGFRHIGGTRVTKQQEARIASRLDSPEIDMTDETTGTWGSLPGPIKKQLTLHNAALSIEPASHCTVGCSFCTLANHGPIAAKASFDSIIEIVDFFNQHQGQYDGWPKSDYIYHGSDPFDLKWQSPGGREQDYTDLARAYRRTTGHNRQLFTSTAVPLGEEWRVLRHAVELFDRADKESSLRFSITETNQERVGHMIKILRFLDATRTQKLEINDHASAPDWIARRGPMFLKHENFRLIDVFGPERIDGVVIGATAIRSMVLRGATRSHPYGYDQRPLSKRVDGGRRYSIPRYYQAPDEIDQIENLRQPAIIDHLIIPDDGHFDSETGIQTEVQEHNPYRALYRVALGYHLLHHEAGWVISDRMKQRFTELFSGSVEDMRAHITPQRPNAVMSAMLTLIEDSFSQET